MPRKSRKRNNRTGTHRSRGRGTPTFSQAKPVSPSARRKAQRFQPRMVLKTHTLKHQKTVRKQSRLHRRKLAQAVKKDAKRPEPRVALAPRALITKGRKQGFRTFYNTRAVPRNEWSHSRCSKKPDSSKAAKARWEIANSGSATRPERYQPRKWC